MLSASVGHAKSDLSPEALHCRITSSQTVIFTSFKTYKTLKLGGQLSFFDLCFAPFKTYKTLKPRQAVQRSRGVLHPSKLTRLSN